MPILIALLCARALMNGTAPSADAATAALRIFLLVSWLIAVSSSGKSFKLDGVEIRGQHDLEQLAIGRVIEHAVLDLRRLQPAGALLHGVHALPLELVLDPAVQHVDELQLDVVVVPLRNHLGIARRHHADHVRLHHAAGRLRECQVAVLGIASQPGVEVLLALVLRQEALLRLRLGLSLRGHRFLLMHHAEPRGRSSIRSGQQLGAACAANTTASATCSEVSGSNLRFWIASSTRGWSLVARMPVSTMPGAILVTLMPCDCNSMRKPRAIAESACLVAQ